MLVPNRIIASFAAALVGHYAQSTIINYLAAIRAWHIIHGLHFETDKPTMDSILRAAQTLAPLSSKQSKCPPLQTATITSIKASLDMSTPSDAAIFACLTMTFWCAARLGEFTVKRYDNFNPSKNITRAHMQIRTIETHNITQYIFHLPWTKTSPTGEEVF